MGLGVTVREIGQLVKKGATLEAQKKISELREAIVELEESVLELRKRNRELEEELALRERLVYEAPYYWVVEEAGREGPYCQACRDKDQKLVRLQANGNTEGWHCTVCKNGYHAASWRGYGTVVAKTDGLFS